MAEFGEYVQMFDYTEKSLKSLLFDDSNGYEVSFCDTGWTEVWPERDEWKNKILLVETSEEKPSPDLITYYLRNLGTQGILNWLQNSRNIRYFIESVTVLTVCNSKRL